MSGQIPSQIIKSLNIAQGFILVNRNVKLVIKDCHSRGFPLRTRNSSFGSFVFKISLSPLSKLYSQSLNLTFSSFKVTSAKISCTGSIIPILSETTDLMFSGSKIAKISSSISFKLLHSLFILFCKANYFACVALVSLIQPLPSSRVFWKLVLIVFGLKIFLESESAILNTNISKLEGMKSDQRQTITKPCKTNILLQNNSKAWGFKEHSQQVFKLKQFLKNQKSYQAPTSTLSSQHQINACQQNVLIHASFNKAHLLRNFIP